jgi:NAD(P)-dependent dehydrogenase (short-subunit alcohol dehydrogenase family)
VLLHYGSGAAEVAAVAADIERAGGKALTLQADLSRSDGAAKLAAAVGAALGERKLDILVNNAGIAPFASTAETDEATFDRIVNVNMKSLFFVTQRLLGRLADGGRIVNVSSAVTRTVFPGIPVYSASKGFVDVLTLQWAGELGPRGITVNAVAPGAIDTQMSAWIHGPGGTDTLKAIQALAGIGKPEHVAGVVAFLAGPDGAWTTGQIVDASGGTKL